MIGQTISHYNILEELGRGGMGVVYRAHDTKLERDVALKFLPPHLSASEQDKARFVQEAKAAATLDHANICTVYSIEEHEGRLFIAMQFVDGQLLRDRMSGMTQKQALETGIQIAEGLAAAHEKGVVHRDIKPENIMIRKDGVAQIMDFGLAKLKGVSRLTKEGSTVGTAGYMSPEQIQGQDADHRSDIFSLGVLLYEMLTGQLPFRGVHETAMAYEIVNVDATPMAAVKPEIDPALDAIILECLEKDPNERTQSARQVSIDLKRVRRESSRQRASRITAARPVLAPGGAENDKRDVASDEHAPGQRFRWVLAAVAAILLLCTGYGIAWFTSPAPVEMPAIRASVNLPRGVRYNDGLGGHSAISPDGKMMVFLATDSLSHSTLWVRALSSEEAKPLSGTDGATYPFWSPDGRMIGFFSEGKVRTVDAAGGPVLTLADAPFGRGAAWSSGGEILYSPSLSDQNLFAVPSAGGTVRQVTGIDSTIKGVPRFPHFLPDGNHFVFSLLDIDDPENHAALYVGSLGSRETSLLVDGASHGVFSEGFLFFLRQGILMAQQFDPAGMVLSGKPVSVQGSINVWSARAKADFSLSQNGILLYAGNKAAGADEVVWVGRDGSLTPVASAKVFTTMALSPDGRKIAFDEVHSQTGSADVWTFDIARKTRTRITFAPVSGSAPCWSLDGRHIFYNTEEGASKANIERKPSDGTGERELIAREEGNASVGYYPLHVSPDGRFLLIRITNESKSELGTIDLGQKQRPIPVEKLGIEAREARFSPDGKWIAYLSGENAIYVSSFRGEQGKWQLLQTGGSRVRWSGGSIIYYSGLQNRYERVDVSFPGGTPTFASAQPLFPPGRGQNDIIFDASGDGQKYLAVHPANASIGSNLSIIVNWIGLVREQE
jgi:Tol biopolymer transport system component/predicted Ser/Thr protein kinase